LRLTRDPDGHIAPVSRAVAEPPAAPAVHDARPRDGTRVPPCTDAGERQPARHCDRCWNDGPRRAVAELSGVVRSPAIRRPGRRDGARVLRTRADLAETQAARDLHGHRAAAAGIKTGALGPGGGPDPEPTVVVLAPAVRAAVHRETAGMGLSGIDCHEYRSEGEDWSELVDQAAIAESAGPARAPAVREAAGRETARVSGAHREARERQSPRDRDRHRALRNRCRAETQCAGLVRSPTVRRSVRRERAGVAATHANRDVLASSRDGHRDGRAGVRSVTELAYAVVAPTIGEAV